MGPYSVLNMSSIALLDIQAEIWNRELALGIWNLGENLELEIQL